MPVLTNAETDLLLDALDHMQNCAGQPTLKDWFANAVPISVDQFTQQRAEEAVAKAKAADAERKRVLRNRIILLTAKLVQAAEQNQGAVTPP